MIENRCPTPEQPDSDPEDLAGLIRRYEKKHSSGSSPGNSNFQVSRLELPREVAVNSQSGALDRSPRSFRPLRNPPKKSGASTLEVRRPVFKPRLVTQRLPVSSLRSVSRFHVNREQNLPDNVDNFEVIAPSVDEPRSFDNSTFSETSLPVFDSRNSSESQNTRGLYPPRHLSSLSDLVGSRFERQNLQNKNLTSRGDNSSLRHLSEENRLILTSRRCQINPQIDISIDSRNLE